MARRADARFLLPLGLVSVVVVAGVLLWTRGTSRQLQVEGRIRTLVEDARRTRVPLASLMALCIAEAHRERPRSDRELAGVLADSLRDRGEDVEGAMRAIIDDEIEAAMTVDLMQRNRERWVRLVADRVP